MSRLGVTKIAVPERTSTRFASARTRSGSATCSSDCTASTESKLPSANGSARMSAAMGLALLSHERGGIDVDTDGLARRERLVAVADAAAEVQHPARREQVGAQLVGRDMTLPGRIEAALAA